MSVFGASPCSKGRGASDTVIDGYRNLGAAEPHWRVAVTLLATAEFAEQADAERAHQLALTARGLGHFGTGARIELERWLPDAAVWLPCIWVAAPDESDH
jgi:hypothetical protein